MKYGYTSIITIICTVMLLAAVYSLPYVYYIILRYSVSICALSVIISDWRKGISYSNLTMLLIALTYNPLYPFRMEQIVWRIVDIIAAIIFALRAFSDNNKKA